jgi:Ca2+-binding EF-hand superfamily protein
MLDTDGNGTLEASDFAVMSKNAGTADLWNELKENFDENGDEQISFDEFKRHIANTVAAKIPLGSIPRKDWTWRQVSHPNLFLQSHPAT